MSSISSVSSYSAGTSYTGVSATQRRQRPDAEQMAADLFSKLDTSGKGYIEQSDLETALSELSSSSTQAVSGGATASEIFSQLDSDSDGKITEDEMSTSLKKLAESLDDQFDQSRMQGAMAAPPPPPSDDAGFTEEELTTQLSEIGSTDSARSSLLTKIVENFDAADTNEDGKVSFTEAMAYDQSSTSSTSSTTSSSDVSSTSSSDTESAQTADAKIFRQIMELMRSYGADDSSTGVLGALASTISTSA